MFANNAGNNPNPPAAPLLSPEAMREQDFLKGDWLLQMDEDYKAYLNTGGIRKVYWEEAYGSMYSLWDKAKFDAFVQQVENKWKAKDVDTYSYIPLKDVVGPKTGHPYPSNSYPQGGMLHVQYNCPASYYYVAVAPKAGAMQEIGVPKGPINFADPNKEYLNPLKSAIRSLHFDLYNTYRSVKNIKDPHQQKLSLTQMFGTPTYGCLNEKFVRLEGFHLNLAKAFKFDFIVEMILQDYTKFICQANDWPIMDYNTLAVKDDGMHFYFEDIVAFAKANHGAMKSVDGKKVKDDFEATLDAWALADKRPANAPQPAIVPAPVAVQPAIAVPQPIFVDPVAAPIIAQAQLGAEQKLNASLAIQFAMQEATITLNIAVNAAQLAINQLVAAVQSPLYKQQIIQSFAQSTNNIKQTFNNAALLAQGTFDHNVNFQPVETSKNAATASIKNAIVNAKLSVNNAVQAAQHAVDNFKVAQQQQLAAQQLAAQQLAAQQLAAQQLAAQQLAAQQLAAQQLAAQQEAKRIANAREAARLAHEAEVARLTAEAQEAAFRRNHEAEQLRLRNAAEDEQRRLQAAGERLRRL
jgi:hypothetical protein